MTNGLFDKWKNYTKYLFTTDTYIEFGWLFIITTALQRRVWFGDIESGQPLFCNLYGTLVGPPAVGKGMILSIVKDFLTHHKVINGYEYNPAAASDYERVKNARLLFPKGPEDITYQAFTKDLSETILKHRYVDAATKKQKIYVHSSMFFILEELESLFKRGDNDDRLHKFLLQTWDCKDVRYKTKHEGDNEIHNPCVSILAGVQPDRLARLFQKDILTDGFISRTILVFETASNRREFFLRQPDSQMRQDREDILKHLFELSKLYGEIKIQPEALEFLQNWFETDYAKNREKVPGKLESYYDRKPAHIQKLAAGYWFTDNLSLEMPVEPFKRAIDFLDKIEKNMYLGIAALGGRNELNKLSRDILNYIAKQRDGASIVDLLVQFNADVNLQELQEILNELLFIGKIQNRGEKYYVK